VLAPTIDSALIAGRIDNAAAAAAAAAAADAATVKTVDDGIQTCGLMSRSINSCASPLDDDARVCKNCLKALSPGIRTGSGKNKNVNAVAGVAQCAHSPFCGECTSDDLHLFLACGLQLEVLTRTATVTTTVITTTTDPNDMTTSTTATTTVTNTDTSTTVVIPEEQQAPIDDISVVVVEEVVVDDEKEPIIVVVVDFDAQF